MSLAQGQVLQNRYRIVKLLGQGGFGAVYKAWDLNLERPCAVKEMIPDPNADARTLSQLRAQFRREAQVLASLHHPNLPRVIDHFEVRGNAYLVMDFVEGHSLEDVVSSGPLSEGQVLDYALQLLNALEYCHQRGVVHRDIKPDNIILTPEGQVVLVDFGLVKLYDPANPATITVLRGRGTPGYAPPEQYDYDPGHTDLRSDIYSLGATLYHLLSGDAPPSPNRRMANPAVLFPPRKNNPKGVSRIFGRGGQVVK